MDNFRNAAKAFIVNDGKLLLVRRNSSNQHKPDEWDIPGGRLEIGEYPYDGLKRELREETGNEIEIMAPLDVRHFTRDDGQVITMIMFFCKLLSNEIRLSDEHTEYKWVNLTIPEIPEYYHNAFANYRNLKNA